MLRGVFVTGTDTNVGKTVVAAALLCRYRQLTSLRYWKPIQTGIETDNDTAEVRRLSTFGPDRVLDAGTRLPQPVSPHLAARRNGSTIDVGALIEMIRSQPTTDRWIIEGAGGVLVPVNADDLMVDLIRRIGLPAIIVARSVLGTINHTLLTLEALRARSASIAGVVLVGPTNVENRDAIEQYGQIHVLGELPTLDPLEPETLTRWAETALDPHSRLLDCLR